MLQTTNDSFCRNPQLFPTCKFSFSGLYSPLIWFSLYLSRECQILSSHCKKKLMQKPKSSPTITFISCQVMMSLKTLFSLESTMDWAPLYGTT